MTDTKLDGLIAARDSAQSYLLMEIAHILHDIAPPAGQDAIGRAATAFKSAEQAIAAERNSAEVQTGVSRPVILTDEEIAHLQDCQTNPQKPTPSILEAAQLMKDMYPDPPAKRKSAEGREEASAVEEAYGILWRQVTDNKQIHQARKLLLSLIDVAGQRRGINSAVKQFGPVNPYEISGLADFTSPIPPAKEQAASRTIDVDGRGMPDGATTKHIAAFTPTGANYPPFVSINEYSNGVEIIVRSKAKADGACGSVSDIFMSRTQFDSLVSNILASLRAKPDAGAFAEGREIVRCDHCDNGIQPDWGYCAYCGDVLLTADEKADVYCQTPGTIPLEPDPLHAMAEDMAKALAEGINYQQQMGIPTKWGRDVLTQMRDALEAYDRRTAHPASPASTEVDRG